MKGLLIGPVEAVDVSTSHHWALGVIISTQRNKCLKSKTLSVIMKVIYASVPQGAHQARMKI